MDLHDFLGNTGKQSSYCESDVSYSLSHNPDRRIDQGWVLGAYT